MNVVGLQSKVFAVAELTPVCADIDYARPTKRWLLNEFAKFFQEQLEKWRVSKWDEQWDCDDFAALYRVHASLCHRLSGEVSEQGIAVGEFWYKTSTGSGHAINVAVVEDDEIIFLEPQSCEEIELSSAERSSCFFCRF